MRNAAWHKRALDLFDQVVDLSPEQRGDFLARECAGDDELRAKVEAMLRQDASGEGRFEGVEGVDALASDLFEDHDKDTTPEQIGAYRVVGEVGHGGMGVIYEATQESPHRRVALKILRPGLVSRDLMRRFQREAHVLGRLQHPGIAHIHEAGVAELQGGRRPFFAMEFVDGLPLDRHVEHNRLTVRERLELIARVCDAVEYAHRKGVIHRDLKPSNILVVSAEAPEATTDAVGQPKVLDFGIARVVDPELEMTTIQTEAGQIVGTLAYMSPEQILGDASAIDTRCDVYALGLIAYEMLAGAPARDVRGVPFAEIARRIHDDEPRTLAGVDRTLAGDVSTIVAKAMSTDPSRRYGAAGELAADIRRFLANQPIEARPASTFYQLGKFARRNKGLVAGVLATMVALAAGLTGTAYALVQAQHQRDEARGANDRLQSVVEYQSEMLRRVDVQAMGRAILDDQRTAVREALQQAPEVIDAFEQAVSQVNMTTIASRSMDRSIMTPSVAALEASFADQDLLRADLRFNLTEIYVDLGLTEKALEQAEIQRSTLKMQLGARAPETLRTEQSIVDMLLQLARPDEAEPRLEALLDAQRSVLGSEHPDSLVTLRLLGWCQHQLTRFDESIATLEAARSGLALALGAEHPQTMLADQRLGDVHLSNGDLDSALRAFEAVANASEAWHGPEHPETILALGGVARVHFRRTDYAPAAAIFERSSELLAAQKGGDHPDTLAARHNLGLCLVYLGIYEDAEPIVRDTLDRRSRVFGPDHINTVRSRAAYGRLMLSLRRFSEAERMLTIALQVARRTLGPDDIGTLVAMSDVTSVLFRSEQFEQAEIAGREALEAFRRVLGPEHIRTLASTQLYARVLMCSGALEDAEAHLGEVRRICRERYPTNVALPGSLGRSVSVLLALDRPEEAAILAQELKAWCVEQGVTGPTMGKCHLWVARTQAALRDSGAASASLDQVLAAFDEASAEHNWVVAAADAMKHAMAFENGDASAAEYAREAHERLLDLSAPIPTEERALVLPEIRDFLKGMGVEL